MTPKTIKQKLEEMAKSISVTKNGEPMPMQYRYLLDEGAARGFIKGGEAMQKLLVEAAGEEFDWNAAEETFQARHPNLSKSSCLPFQFGAEWAHSLRTAQVQALKEEIILLTIDQHDLAEERDELILERDQLKKELAEAREVIEFYGNLVEEKWKYSEVDGQRIKVIVPSPLSEKARKFLGGE